MPQVAIPEGFAELVVKSTNAQNSNPIINVLGIGYDVGEPIDDVLDQIQIAFVAFAPFFTDNVTMNEVIVRLGAASPPYIALPVPINIVGINTDDACNPNESVLVTKAGTIGGRHGKGRNYWYGLVADSDVDGGGNIDPTMLGTVQSTLDNLNTDLGTAPLLGMFLLHQDTYVGTPTSVFAYTAQSMMATQRRRLR